MAARDARARVRRILCVLLPLVGVMACSGQRRDEGPVEVSVIGPAPTLADPDREPLTQPSRVLLGAAAQGLVRFDASGQVEPALAERWIVIGEGTSYIFRLRDARWSDGSPVTAEQVARRLRAAIARRSRNPLRPFLSAIDEVVVMTPQVIEVRLTSPRPELLRLLAQPEMAMTGSGAKTGSGPLTITGRAARTVTLRPSRDVAGDADAPAASPDPRETVILRGERAARAVARFARQDLDLVLGGTFADRPILTAADIAGRNIRVDQASGLFGLAVANRQGFLADVENRTAVAMAIDRPALATALGAEWRAETRILPARYEAARAPVEAGWASLDHADRRRAAAQRIAAWRSANPDLPPLRIALPDGPGSTLLFARLSVDLAAVGLSVRRVAATADADLRLIDEVAPSENARWFLATACAPCGDVPAFALEAARTAPTVAERAARLSEADSAVAADVPFIALAQPVRWSLVSLRLRQWTANPRSVHPLNHLRGAPN